MKIFFRKLENKLHSEMRYLEYIKQKTSFRRAIWHQVGLLVKAIESNNVDKKKFEEMLRGIPQFVTEDDSIKLYKIHGNGEVYCWGNAKKEISEEVIII